MTKLVLIAAAVFLVSCNSGQNDAVGSPKPGNLTSINWEEPVKNIGVVEPGAEKEVLFSFKNTGEKPLFIISARPGCGCTVADYPRQAIAPGKSGTLKAAYHAPDGEGEFRKNIVVAANTADSMYSLYFYGVIRAAKDTTAKKDN